MLLRARDLDDGAELSADVCVVGSGPAGLTLALRLVERGLSVVVLESGSDQAVVRAQELSRGQVVGQPTWPLHRTRHRELGGSGQHWGGMCRPLDPEDFDRASWVPHSGWPVSHEAVAAYLPDAYEALGLRGPAATPDRALPDDGGFAERAGLRLVDYDLSPYRFGFVERLRPRLDSAPGLKVVVEATVVDLALAPASSRVERVRVRGEGDATFDVRAGDVVLAAGGVENARILLDARTDRPAGLGNENDLVGRFFMDHVHAQVGYLLLDRARDSSPLFRALDHSTEGSTIGPALAGSPSVRASEHLLAAAFTATRAPHRFSHPPLSLPLRVNHLIDRARRHEALDQIGVASAPPRTPFAQRLVQARWRLWSIGFTPTRRRLGALARAQGLAMTDVRSLYVRSEQAPNPQSRVRLGTKVDRTGLREAVLDWKVSATDTDSVTAWVDHIEAAAKTEPGVLLVRDAEWQRSIVGGPHHMGTTRMAASPRDGVVDEHGRVHSLDNLHVAGSSVFPTGGYANPTLTLIALSLRLADRLASLSRRPIGIRDTDVTAPRPAGEAARRDRSGPT